MTGRYGCAGSIGPGADPARVHSQTSNEYNTKKVVTNRLLYHELTNTLDQPTDISPCPSKLYPLCLDGSYHLPQLLLNSLYSLTDCTWSWWAWW